MTNMAQGASGPPVGQLHTVLQSLGFQIPAEEQAAQHFGPATVAAVQQFQAARQLPATGTLTAETVAALNAAVAQPAPAQPAQPAPAQPAPPAQPQPVQPAPGLTDRPIVNPVVNPGNIPVDRPPVPDPVGVDPRTTYTVTGVLTAPGSASVAKLTVQLVDKNVGGDTVLTAAQTDLTGHYTIQVAIPSSYLTKHGKTAPDLQVRLLQGDAVTATSIVRYSATVQEQLDITVAPGRAQLTSEYEALTSAIASVYGGSLTALRETADQQDITYLANRTGWDARAIVMAAQAAQLAQPPAVATTAVAAAVNPAPPAPFYYALLRAGLPADHAQLHATDPQAVATVWKDAIDQNLLPSSLANSVDSALTSYRTIAASAALTAQPVVGSSSLSALLSARLDQSVDREQQFAALLTDRRADPTSLWAESTKLFGPELTSKLQFDGQLAYLTLNNAPLGQALTGKAAMSAPVDLVTAGLHDSAAWLPLLADIDAPPEFAAATPDEAKSNYADALAAHVRLSFPTATVGHLVSTVGVGVDEGSQQAVASFLTTNQAGFDIGAEPIGQFLERTGTTAAPDVVSHVARIQRLYQITPNLTAMSALAAAGLDSAHAVAQLPADRFVTRFAQAMGGAEIAALTHSRALTIHATTLHLALAFLTGQRAPMLGITGSANLVDTVAGLATKLAGGAGAAQATLQDLFGNLDYCDCDDCRSIIGPAAYLVDLLDYIDNDGPTDGFDNPLKVLLTRRPDIGALPLTCENTNTALPYIDLVNEILEYYVGNAESLANYPGHNTTADIDSAELVAAPQNDDDLTARAAYTLLEQKVFPPPLPFDRDLALLRAHISSLGSSLHEVLRVLRPRDTLDPAPADDPSYYGWRDVLIERIGLSRKQVQLLTASTAVTIQDLYGYPPGTDVASEVSTLQEFSRRTGVSYDDIVAILQTRTVNPQSALLPLLQALDVPVATLQQVHTGALDATGLAGLLPSGLDPAAYGGTQLVDVATWVTTNYDTLMQLIVIDVAGSPSDTTKMRLQHLDPDPGHAQLTMLDLYRLIRFIRLWRALDLDIATTDDLIQAFFVPTDPTTDTDLERFDSGMQTVVLRCGLAYRCLDLLGLDPATGLGSLLTCWGPMSTNGPSSLYSTLFLTPTVLKQNPAFAPDIEGRILEVAGGGPAPTVVAEKDTLCAAFGLTSAEFDLLTGTGSTVPPLAGIGLGYDATTVLNLARLSELYRHAWLSRVLQISIVELRSLVQLTGIDPFSTPVLDPALPVSAGLLDFVRLVQSLTAAGLAPVQAAYLLWNADLSGVSTPPADAAVGLAVQLRAGFATIDAQFAVPTNPTADSAKNLMALVLGSAAADEFFGLLTGTYVLAVPFSYSSYTLPAAVVAAAPGRIAYDDLGKQLTFAGYLDASTATSLQTAAGTDAPLVAGIGALAAAAASARSAFLDQYANETLPLAAPFDAYFGSPDATVRRSFSALLGALLPILATRRKQLQSLAVVSSVAGHDQSFANALLTDRNVMPASTDPSEPAVADLIAVGAGGLTAEFHSDNNLGSAAALRTPSVLDFDTDVNPLPAPTGGATGIAARWTGFIVADQAGTFGLQVRANVGATVSAQIGGVDVQLATTDGTTWLNQHPITLDATVPSSITITATNLAGSFHVLWETTGTGWRPVPAGNLYAAADIDAIGVTLTRFLKIVALGTDLGLTAADLAFLATKAGLTVGGVAWTSQLVVSAVAPPASYAALTTTLRGLLTYTALKGTHGRNDDRVLVALTSLVDDAAVTKLATLTGWDADSLSTLSTRIFGADLGSIAGPLAALDRLAEAFAVLATCKLPAATLIAAANVVPTPEQVQTFQSAVRSRYAEADWLTAVQAINDEIRTRQRDALVAYVLLQSGTSVLASLGVAASANRVPTAEDLFNFFLVDTEMAPCMLTSRIRHALSSVQLFIERCLRNLEPHVNPKDIDGSQWVWRKRYRVWQANREVFLWPENWMDESLRDDQSPFFKSTLSTLLQSDITDDSAATAYLDYLTNLEQVAKLEPCGLYLDAGAAGTDDDVVHVVSRSAGSHRKHYYRSFASGSWTPWADTKLTIEDHPVVPYVWNDRLMIFWLQVHRKSQVDSSAAAGNLPTSYSGEASLANSHLSDLSQRVGSHAGDATAEQISVVLCFSEFYNGGWQPVRTSDISNPAFYRTVTSGSFDRTKIDLRPFHSADSNDEALYVQIVPRLWRPDLNPEWGPLVFVVHNTHSAPEVWSSTTLRIDPADPSRRRSMPPSTGGGGTELLANYATREPDDPQWGPQYSDGTDVKVLSGRMPLTVRQAQLDVTDQWSMPFLMSDARSAFYVTSSVSYRWFRDFAGYGLLGAGQVLRQSMVNMVPSVVVARPPLQPGAPVEITARLGDPQEAQNALVQASGLHAVLGSADTVNFEGVAIGAGGSIDRASTLDRAANQIVRAEEVQ